jgi:hypothetical protein
MSSDPSSKPDLWPLIIALERAAWSRKWASVKLARRALEAALGTPRPKTRFSLYEEWADEHKEKQP